MKIIEGILSIILQQMTVRNKIHGTSKYGIRFYLSLLLRLKNSPSESALMPMQK